MNLSKIQFTEYPRGPREWRLRPVALGQIKLIVGRNASGKTRFLNIIVALSQLLSGRVREIPFEDGHYRVQFLSGPRLSKYSLQIQKKQVIRETYSTDGEALLDRKGDGKGKIKAVELNRPISFECATNQLAAVLKRDAIQHPFLQELHDWGASVKHYRFGTTMGADQLAITPPPSGDRQDSPPPIPEFIDPNQLFVIYQLGFARFGRPFSTAILRDMKALDYPLTAIGVDHLTRSEFQGSPLPPAYLFVKERDLKCNTRQHEMSSGMFRAFSIATQLNFWERAKTPACLLIDDIGEGLDFARTTRLLKLLIDKTNANGFQLIMTTNDRFVMNTVPLQYWGVLERRGHRVWITSEDTSPEVFKHFREIGLSNFDFFARRLYKATTPQ